MRKLILTLCAILMMNGCIIWHELGGASRYQPKDLEHRLSTDAQALLHAALSELKGQQIFDYHAHVIGLGQDDTGIYLNKRVQSWLHPEEHVRFLIFSSASGLKNFNHADRDYVLRLIDLVKFNPSSPKLLLLPFEHYYDSAGNIDLNKTEFYVPNKYVFSIMEKYPQYFQAAMSVHPYRQDAISELEKWAKKGIRIVKWLPNSMGIDPQDSRCDPFYKKMHELNLILLTHTGEEQAVGPNQKQEYGNPLLLRRALDHGVKIIAAHCASLGENEDLDNPGAKETSFRLFMRLMDDPKYKNLLFGDISAITFFNRTKEPLLTLLERPDIHERLVYGSDYPLPAVNFLVHTRDLQNKGFITKEECKALNEIYNYNPLLFDLVLKRTLKHPKTGQKFSSKIFLKNPLLSSVAIAN